MLGRNCRFMQGEGTDPKANGELRCVALHDSNLIDLTELIRHGLQEGRDVSVCLLNYKADGTPFWNQFFMASLRDSSGKIVNFVGVQCDAGVVSAGEMEKIAERVKNA